ncbi:MAG: DUF554 domain-containing protein [Lachnospiraceae bacterium]|nr:DUF554 domain-containing protein [Lachnospiraceae bacterium]
MFGVFVNMATIVVGGIIGNILKDGIPKNVSHAVTEVIGLVSLTIGIQGAIKGVETVVVLSALVVGTMVGTFLDIDKMIKNIRKKKKKRFTNDNSLGHTKFVDAFVTSSVLFGIGAMAVLGSIDAGLNHNYQIFYLKALMDGVTSVMFATTLGIGVCFSAITIFLFQGTMTLLAGFLKPIAENIGMMNEITCCGNIMIIAIGLNVLGIMKIKIANMLPAIILTPIIYAIYMSIVK